MTDEKLEEKNMTEQTQDNRMYDGWIDRFNDEHDPNTIWILEQGLINGIRTSRTSKVNRNTGQEYPVPDMRKYIKRFVQAVLSRK